MNALFMKKPHTLGNAKKVLSLLEIQLGDLYETTVNMIRCSPDDPSKVTALSPMLYRLAELVQVVKMTKKDLQIDAIDCFREHLQEWTREFARSIETDPQSTPQLQRIATQAIQAFIKAEAALKPRTRAPGKEVNEPQKLEILIRSDLLFQCYQSLFPAERMLAISGRRRRWQIELGAAFDVTGNASSGHVWADPRKLGQALIAMSSADTPLAAWFHSHPGTGPLSTVPSGTDLRQHADWLHDYSSQLLSGIFVHDHYLRFWGSALEQGSIRVRILGTGIAAIKGEDHVYQFVTG